VDAVSAFLQSLVYRSEPNELVVVRPPPGEDDGFLWDLDKALPGLRRSSVSRQDTAVTEFLDMGMERCPQEPQLFSNDAKHLKLGMESHGDDSLLIGTRSELEWFRDEITKRIDCNCSPIIGKAPDLAKDGKWLKRPFGWRDKGWFYEADPKHTRNLRETLNLANEDAKAAATPGEKQVVDFIGSEEPVERAEHKTYRRAGAEQGDVPGRGQAGHTVREQGVAEGRERADAGKHGEGEALGALRDRCAEADQLVPAREDPREANRGVLRR